MGFALARIMTRRWISVLLLLAACDPGSDLPPSEGEAEQDGALANESPKLEALPERLTFHLNYKQKKDWSRCADRDVVVFDMFDSSEADFAKCEALGAMTLCYFSSQYEDWREDSGDFGSLGPALDDWDGERWVDPEDAQNLEVMKRRLDLAVSRGCDGVDVDNIDRDGHEDYVIAIFEEAHARGLYVSQKNAIEKIERLWDYVDLYQNEQCQELDECDAYDGLGRPVYNIEYRPCKTLPYLYSNRKDMEGMDAWEAECAD